MFDEIIEEAYEETNYGATDKIYSYLKKHNLEKGITKKDIHDFLDKQEQEQILKQTRKPKAQGHIVSSFPNEIAQIDIFDLSKYENYNKHVKYIFAYMDVFSRFAFALPMKTKNIDDTTEALEKIIKVFGAPKIIISDNDSSFLGSKFQDLLEENDIILNTNVKDDHLALGIIDNFAKRLKMVFSKIFIKFKTKNWIDHLADVVRRYNLSPHPSLGELSPDEALEEKNKTKIFEINNIKSLKNKTVVDLEPGDKVRIKIGGTFTKSSEPQFSDEIYTVESVDNTVVHLTNGEKKKRYNLLKVPKETIIKSNEKNVITQVSNKARENRRNKKAGVSEENIIRESSTRIRKAPEKLDL